MRRDISIEINVIRRCTPAECYVYRRRKNRLYKGTLPKYLHTLNSGPFNCTYSLYVCGYLLPVGASYARDFP